MIELVPMINEPDGSGSDGELAPVETDKKWNMIEEAANTEMKE